MPMSHASAESNINSFSIMLRKGIPDTPVVKVLKIKEAEEQFYIARKCKYYRCT
jgi:hypothetical protein